MGLECTTPGSRVHAPPAEPARHPSNTGYKGLKREKIKGDLCIRANGLVTAYCGIPWSVLVSDFLLPQGNNRSNEYDYMIVSYFKHLEKHTS